MVKAIKNRIESYLVRIYRRGTAGEGIAGTVEIIAKERTEAFRSSAELLEIMMIHSLYGVSPDKHRRPGEKLKSRNINPKQLKGREK